MGRKKKPPRCAAKTKSGKRCTRRATKGRRCGHHPPKKGGRPQKTWDELQWKQFDTFCAARVPKGDIAEAMATDAKTIEAICQRAKGIGFSEYLEQKKGYGKALLAGKQLEVAMSGNVAMLIWLGKQWLDQKEPKQFLEHTGKDSGPIEKEIQVRFIDAGHEKPPG